MCYGSTLFPIWLAWVDPFSLRHFALVEILILVLLLAGEKIFIL